MLEEVVAWKIKGAGETSVVTIVSFAGYGVGVGQVRDIDEGGTDSEVGGGTISTGGDDVSVLCVVIWMFGVCGPCSVQCSTTFWCELNGA